MSRIVQAIEVVAILRGLQPDEAVMVVTALLDAGFRAIEVPLNRPNAIAAITVAVEVARSRGLANCLIGAGTVLSADDVQRVTDSGGNLIVAPNINLSVIAAAKAAGHVVMPGVFTPTEALLARGPRPTALKLFPANALGPEGWQP